MSGARNVSVGVCISTYVVLPMCVILELVRCADLTALVPEHTDYLLHVPGPDSNRASFDMPEKAILQLVPSARLQSDFQKLFSPFQAVDNLASNVPKAFEIWLLTLPN